MESCKDCRVFVLFTVALLSLTSHLTRGQDTADCPADGRTWLPFGDNCYHFVHGEEDTAQSYSFESAQDKCKLYGLLTVKSAPVNDFIVKYIPNVWKHDVNIWLGIDYDSDDDVFRWIDDESVLLYNNWEDGGSDETDLALMDTCIVLHSSTGKWENVSCLNEPATGVVCQTKAVWPSAPKSSPFLSALVIISVVLILVVSAVVWFLHQRNSPGSSILNLIEYNPPFRSPSADQTCLVEAEEVEDIP